MDKQLRYSSHIRLEGFGKQSQTTLLGSSVLIVGAGGLGSIASLYLTTSGIGHITIVDFDSIDESNLPRQILFKADDLGQNKALVTKQRLTEYNPDSIINSIDKKLSEDEMIARSKEFFFLWTRDDPLEIFLANRFQKS